MSKVTAFRIVPVVLCGGSGTRLWPLSRKSFPKQFVPLVGDQSLLQLTLARVAAVGPEVVCVASEEHRFLVADTMSAAGVSGQVLLEPAARNTAAAMAIAALTVGADDLLLVCPSDHHIPGVEAFADRVRSAQAAAADGAIVTFGVVPTYPSSAYGYIQQGAPLPAAINPALDGAAVTRFVEKPSPDKAQGLLLEGGYLWNAGIFMVKASVLLAALKEHAADVLASCEAAMGAATRDGQFVRPEPQAFSACRSESIDYAVMEHARRVAVFPFAGQWSDVGSWNAVAELVPADADGNRVGGQGLALHAQRTYIHAPERPVVALGTQDLLIVDTPDALLIAHKDQAEKVKDVVATLEQRGVAQAAQHRLVARPWGSYDSIDRGERFQVKRITVKPGASLSLQLHHHRAEHWIVVSGTARVTKDDEVFLLGENQSTYIPLGVKHRLENPGKTDLEMIEVQSGSYLGEDDIVRFDDHYGRVK